MRLGRKKDVETHFDLCPRPEGRKNLDLSEEQEEVSRLGLLFSVREGRTERRQGRGWVGTGLVGYL